MSTPLSAGSSHVVLRVGVTRFRYVSHEHIRPWLIHSYKNLKGRGVAQENEDDDGGDINEDSGQMLPTGMLCPTAQLPLEVEGMMAPQAPSLGPGGDTDVSVPAEASWEDGGGLEDPPCASSPDTRVKLILRCRSSVYMESRAVSHGLPEAQETPGKMDPMVKESTLKEEADPPQQEVMESPMKLDGMSQESGAMNEENVAAVADEEKLVSVSAVENNDPVLDATENVIAEANDPSSEVKDEASLHDRDENIVAVLDCDAAETSQETSQSADNTNLSSVGESPMDNSSTYYDHSQGQILDFEIVGDQIIFKKRGSWPPPVSAAQQSTAGNTVSPMKQPVSVGDQQSAHMPSTPSELMMNLSEDFLVMADPDVPALRSASLPGVSASSRGARVHLPKSSPSASLSPAVPTSGVRMRLPAPPLEQPLQTGQPLVIQESLPIEMMLTTDSQGNQELVPAESIPFIMAGDPMPVSTKPLPALPAAPLDASSPASMASQGTYYIDPSGQIILQPAPVLSPTPTVETITLVSDEQSFTSVVSTGSSLATMSAAHGSNRSFCTSLPSEAGVPSSPRSQVLAAMHGATVVQILPSTVADAYAAHSSEPRSVLPSFTSPQTPLPSLVTSPKAQTLPFVASGVQSHPAIPKTSPKAQFLLPKSRPKAQHLTDSKTSHHINQDSTSKFGRMAKSETASKGAVSHSGSVLREPGIQQETSVKVAKSNTSRRLALISSELEKPTATTSRLLKSHESSDDTPTTSHKDAEHADERQEKHIIPPWRKGYRKRQASGKRSSDVSSEKPVPEPLTADSDVKHVMPPSIKSENVSHGDRKKVSVSEKTITPIAGPSIPRTRRPSTSAATSAKLQDLILNLKSPPARWKPDKEKPARSPAAADSLPAMSAVTLGSSQIGALQRGIPQTPLARSGGTDIAKTPAICVTITSKSPEQPVDKPQASSTQDYSRDTPSVGQSGLPTKKYSKAGTAGPVKVKKKPVLKASPSDSSLKVEADYTSGSGKTKGKSTVKMSSKDKSAEKTASKDKSAEKTASKDKPPEKTASKAKSAEKTASKAKSAEKTAPKDKSAEKTASKDKPPEKTASKAKSAEKTASKAKSAEKAASKKYDPDKVSKSTKAKPVAESHAFNPARDQPKTSTPAKGIKVSPRKSVAKLKGNNSQAEAILQTLPAHLQQQIKDIIANLGSQPSGPIKFRLPPGYKKFPAETPGVKMTVLSQEEARKLGLPVPQPQPGPSTKASIASSKSEATVAHSKSKDKATASDLSSGDDDVPQVDGPRDKKITKKVTKETSSGAGSRVSSKGKVTKPKVSGHITKAVKKLAQKKTTTTPFSSKAGGSSTLKRGGRNGRSKKAPLSPMSPTHIKTAAAAARDRAEAAKRKLDVDMDTTPPSHDPEPEKTEGSAALHKQKSSTTKPLPGTSSEGGPTSFDEEPNSEEGWETDLPSEVASGSDDISTLFASLAPNPALLELSTAKEDQQTDLCPDKSPTDEPLLEDTSRPEPVAPAESERQSEPGTADSITEPDKGEDLPAAATKPVISPRAQRRRRTACVSDEQPPETPVTESGMYQRVRLVSRPWRSSDGTVNRPTLRVMLETVMAYVMTNPGVTLTEIIKKYNPILQPVPIRELLEMLEELGCITKQLLQRSHQPSLFSKRVSTKKVTWNSGSETIVYFPSIDCVWKLGEFQAQMGVTSQARSLS